MEENVNLNVKCGFPLKGIKCRTLQAQLPNWSLYDIFLQIPWRFVDINILWARILQTLANFWKLMSWDEVPRDPLPASAANVLQYVSWPGYCECIDGWAWPQYLTVSLSIILFSRRLLNKLTLTFTLLHFAERGKDLNSDSFTRSMKGKFTLPWWRK